MSTVFILLLSPGSPWDQPTVLRLSSGMWECPLSGVSRFTLKREGAVSKSAPEVTRVGMRNEEKSWYFCSTVRDGSWTHVALVLPSLVRFKGIA